MDVLVYLIPAALGLGFLGLAGFLWSMKRGQFDDLDGAGWRAIMDDDIRKDAISDEAKRPFEQKRG